MAGFVDWWRFRCVFGVWPSSKSGASAVKERLGKMVEKKNELFGHLKRYASNPLAGLVNREASEHVERKLELVVSQLDHAWALAERFGHNPGDLVWGEGSLPAASGLT